MNLNVIFSFLAKINSNKSAISTGFSKTYILSLIFLSFFVTQNAYAQPASPAGFVANSTSGSGRVFLACGPNQVGSGNIVYKLYYSETASAPANPLTATEYSFGTTGGDGNGTAAFGFNLSGLTPGTDYSFWLYQYNTVTMLYSATPTPETQTASMPAAQPPTPAGFVANPSSTPGGVFLACGPNDVGSNNVIYRLYYSETATAPANPQTATEYSFGTTGGDGGGTNAFGFTMTGLTPGTDYTFWLYQYNTSSMLFSASPATSTEPAGVAGPPSQPVGFVANFVSDAASSGEVFLACGPNQVGANDIVYKLFYSPTASAPANPISATEYSFGTTGGDGNGTAAFGFRISSLTPGTDYTFWLYQYNTSTMVYSATPDTRAQTSSGVNPLPVVWLDALQAKVVNNNVELTWSVALQINNEKFVVYHSVDGIKFSPIGELNGSGTTNRIEYYTFKQEKPASGYNYYRVKQVDYDGKNEDGNIASLYFGKELETSIFPNPANSNINVNLEANAQVNISNLHGRIVRSLSLNKGDNKISIDDLATGIYFISYKNGSIKSFVKN